MARSCLPCSERQSPHWTNVRCAVCHSSYAISAASKFAAQGPTRLMMRAPPLLAAAQSKPTTQRSRHMGRLIFLAAMITRASSSSVRIRSREISFAGKGTPSAGD